MRRTAGLHTLRLIDFRCLQTDPSVFRRVQSDPNQPDGAGDQELAGGGRGGRGAQLRGQPPGRAAQHRGLGQRADGCAWQGWWRLGQGGCTGCLPVPAVCKGGCCCFCERAWHVPCPREMPLTLPCFATRRRRGILGLHPPAGAAAGERLGGRAGGPGGHPVGAGGEACWGVVGRRAAGLGSGGWAVAMGPFSSCTPSSAWSVQYFRLRALTAPPLRLPGPPRSPPRSKALLQRRGALVNMTADENTLRLATGGAAGQGEGGGGTTLQRSWVGAWVAQHWGRQCGP